mmetsp:Transcript_90160/g.254270  ORF Transcript_90160/g.254270 Transcript_90160/m.254270 type:complete len:209 (+) Transcript_90160:389-1015(+)
MNWDAILLQLAEDGLQLHALRSEILIAPVILGVGRRRHEDGTFCSSEHLVEFDAILDRPWEAVQENVRPRVADQDTLQHCHGSRQAQHLACCRSSLALRPERRRCHRFSPHSVTDRHALHLRRVQRKRLSKRTYAIAAWVLQQEHGAEASPQPPRSRTWPRFRNQVRELLQVNFAVAVCIRARHHGLRLTHRQVSADRRQCSRKVLDA